MVLQRSVCPLPKQCSSVAAVADDAEKRSVGEYAFNAGDFLAHTIVWGGSHALYTKM